MSASPICGIRHKVKSPQCVKLGLFEIVHSMQRQFPVFALHGLTFKNARPVFLPACVLY